MWETGGVQELSNAHIVLHRRGKHHVRRRHYAVIGVRFVFEVVLVVAKALDADPERAADAPRARYIDKGYDAVEFVHSHGEPAAQRGEPLVTLTSVCFLDLTHR